MRKLFRMKYEACTGECYAHSDVMRIHTLGLDEQGAAAFLRRLLAMHNPACGNPNIEFRLDADEFTDFQYNGGGDEEVQRTRFVASMYAYGSLELYGDDTPLGAMNKLIDGALAYYAANPSQFGGENAKRELCHHGEDAKLLEFAISFSGLDAPAQDRLRAQVGLAQRAVPPHAARMH